MSKPTSTMPRRIKAKLKEAKLTQIKIAEKVGASPASVSCWVNGRSTPQGEYLERLADALNVTPIWLINGSEDESEMSADEIAGLLRDVAWRTKEQKYDVAARIKERMHKLEISEKALAEFASVSRTTLRSWLKGATEPRGASLDMVAHALDTTSEWLRNGVSGTPEYIEPCGIADRIKERLNILGLRQIDISDSTGASRGAVSKWVSGDAAPSPNYVYGIARVLSTTPHWLMYGVELAEGEVDEISETYNKWHGGALVDINQSSVDRTSFSGRLKELMKNRSLEQVDLSYATGASTGDVSQWVKGRGVPVGDELIRLAKVLLVTTTYLLHGKGEATEEPIVIAAQEQPKTDTTEGTTIKAGVSRGVSAPVTKKETIKTITEEGSRTTVVNTVITTVTTTEIIEH